MNTPFTTEESKRGGKKGGETTFKRYGAEHFRKLGAKGGKAKGDCKKRTYGKAKNELR